MSGADLRAAFEDLFVNGFLERPTFDPLVVGEAHDMGHDDDGVPLIDPRILDSREFSRNPYPYYRLMRDHYPVFHDRLHNAYFVTRYADITAGYFDEVGFNTIPKGSSSGVLGNTQLELSGIEHRRRRNIYGRHLVGAALTKRLHAIRGLATELIDQWFDPANPKGVVIDRERSVMTIELGRAFANEFPISVVAQVLGIPQDAREQFTWWYDAMMSGLGGSDTHHDGLLARQALEDYVGTLVEERRRKPTHLLDDDGNEICLDIISELCHSEIDGDVMSTEEITSFIALIVGGGGETTRGAILNMWYLLLQHPEQWEAVRDDPQLWNAAFHEMLRHSTSIGGQPRHNTFDLELHGVRVPAGSLMHMVDVSANHDERVFADPERFDIARSDLYTGRILRSGHDRDGQFSHMAFGVGPHLCPGAWISHQEAVIGSQILAERVSGVRIAQDRMPTDLDGVSLAPIGLGSIRELWLEFDL
ncbi:MAG: cytochrome P450 [Actinomycetota bacterium]|nr:cytochrome P450 [Actinomycetota bacterium]MDA3006219.1 cytochrome P450 [Actinomycetota bacterium]MDA3033430.1 cytochrome P450 [Actinomycetota bacterium]